MGCSWRCGGYTQILGVLAVQWGERLLIHFLWVYGEHVGPGCLFWGFWLYTLGVCWGVWVGACAAGHWSVVAVSEFAARRL